MLQNLVVTTQVFPTLPFLLTKLYSLLENNKSDLQTGFEGERNKTNIQNNDITFGSRHGRLQYSTPLSSETYLVNAKNSFSHRMNNFSVNSILGQVRPLSIKDALELIPKYNGVNISLTQFIRDCREACSIIPEQFKPVLAKLIKLRLYGEALKSAAKKVFESINDIANFFDSIFGSAKTYHQLQGELASVKQKRDESVVVLSNRVRAIGHEITVRTSQKKVHARCAKCVRKGFSKVFRSGIALGNYSRNG